MGALTRLLKKSSLAVQVLSGASFFLIWILLRSESFFGRFSDCIIKKTLRVHVIKDHTSVKLFRLLRCYVPAQRYTDEMAKRAQNLNLPVSVSLTSIMHQRFAYTGCVEIPQMKINPKHQGVKFAESLGLRIPAQYQGPIPFNEIMPVERSVIKPDLSFSTKGVFIFKKENEILELETGMVFHSWDALQKRVEQHLNTNNISNDSWVVEEYITDADGQNANDVKFSVFYGRIGWVAELVRHPENLFYTTDNKGKEIDFGLYRKAKRFRGEAATQEEISLVENISLEIPAPFIRIDFLRGKDGLVFGEFTPRPGSTGYLKKEWDQFYGQMYCEAQARLTADLIAGKKFDLFNSI